MELIVISRQQEHIRDNEIMKRNKTKTTTIARKKTKTYWWLEDTPWFAFQEALHTLKLHHSKEVQVVIIKY